MAQPGMGVVDGLEYKWRAVTVLNISAVNDETDQEANGVGDDMALAALDPRIKSGDMPS